MAANTTIGLMAAPGNLDLDVIIFGGGAAGLWVLDELLRRGHRALLLEARALGCGQTIAAQGIIHGGLKYTLDGLFHPSAAAVRDMPRLWRQCLAGQDQPDLSRTQVRADHCHVWQTNTWRSKLGMIGARVGLAVRPTVVAAAQRPDALRACPGAVARLDEPVIDPASLLADLARKRRDHILLFDVARGLSFTSDSAARVNDVLLSHPHDRSGLRLRPRWVLLAAGAGNAALRERLGLRQNAMQLRPLHMVMARGDAATLPELNGHCVDGARTRVTITSARDDVGRIIWQIGGHIAEIGVEMEPRDLCRLAMRELSAVLSRTHWSGVEWATDRVDRAEGKSSHWRRPDDVTILRDGNVMTLWPTKLALVPRLAQRVAHELDASPHPMAHPHRPTLTPFDSTTLALWPRPQVAALPWETATSWFDAP